MPLPDERLRVRGEGVEGVPRLVQQRHDVVHQPDRVHEDERPPPVVQRLAVAARRLALPAVEVEQPLVDHGLELAAERGIDPLEDPRGPADELVGRRRRAGAASVR